MVRSGDAPGAAVGVDTLAGLSAGGNLPASALGSATLAANRVAAGGFDTIGLLSGDAILFDGTVSLTAGRSISLTTAILGSTGATGSASVNAPFVTLTGTGTSARAGLLSSAYQVAAWQPSARASQSALTVNAANIDIGGFLLHGHRVGDRRRLLRRGLVPGRHRRLRDDNVIQRRRYPFRRERARRQFECQCGVHDPGRSRARRRSGVSGSWCERVCHGRFQLRHGCQPGRVSFGRHDFDRRRPGSRLRRHR